jgi:hypothetical protein
VNRLYCVEQVCAGGDEEVREARRDTSRDHRRSSEVVEAYLKTELFCSKRTLGQMGGHVEIVGTQEERGAKDDLIEDRRTGVDQQLSPASRRDNAP